MKVCVITDNRIIYKEFKRITANRPEEFHFFYSEKNVKFHQEYADDCSFKPITLTDCESSFFSNYDLFISLHCKQLFPSRLVNNHRCVNIHPGLNPFNRGWFSQTFSILNHYPVGVTIHEMDEELDHGPIIVQKEIAIESWDTSYDVYEKIISTEIDLLEKNLDDIINNNYVARPMTNEGNINYKKDFDELCKLDLNSVGTLEEHIDLLRAMTFSGYENAFFIDKKGNKIYVSVNLKKSNDLNTSV